MTMHGRSELAQGAINTEDSLEYITEQGVMPSCKDLSFLFWPCLVHNVKKNFTKKRMYAWSTKWSLFAKPFHGWV